MGVLKRRRVKYVFNISYTFTSSYKLTTMPALVLPPFPDNVPTHPLLVIDFALLKVNDPQEIDRLWEAATKLGFW
jgi:hypothetical protein